jgi:hypothetical protein
LLPERHPAVPTRREIDAFNGTTLATDFRAGFATIFLFPMRLRSKERFSPEQVFAAK